MVSCLFGLGVLGVFVCYKVGILVVFDVDLFDLVNCFDSFLIGQVANLGFAVGMMY